MTSLKFHFCHPVTGIIRFLNPGSPKQNRVVLLDAQFEDEVVDIPITDLPEGKWKAFLEWEHNGRNYFYEKEFEIKDRAI